MLFFESFGHSSLRPLVNTLLPRLIETRTKFSYNYRVFHLEYRHGNSYNAENMEV